MWSFQKKLPNAPWLTENAVYLLNSWLKSTDRGFEWGSGRSTSWLVSRSEHIVSIEHHKEWFASVRKQITERNLINKIDYFRIDVDNNYENKIDEYDYLFDYILVDGRRRLECMKKAINKVKPGGILILDNSDRFIPNSIDNTYLSVVNQADKYRNDEWQEVVRGLEQWRQIQTSDGINDTTFWIRPSQ